MLKVVQKKKKNENVFLTIKDVDVFDSSSEQIWSNLEIIFSPLDPLQWMGAVRMRVQSIIIQSSPIQFCEVKIHFDIKTFVTLNLLF